LEEHHNVVKLFSNNKYNTRTKSTKIYTPNVEAEVKQTRNPLGSPIAKSCVLNSILFPRYRSCEKRERLV